MPSVFFGVLSFFSPHMIIIHLQKLRKKKQWHVVGFEPRLPCDSLYHQSLGKDTHELVFVDITSLLLIVSDLLV